MRGRECDSHSRLTRAMTVPASRRAPLQARSNQTVEEILDAASALLGRVPFEQITTSRIAGQAVFSVGARYRFYSDRQEIFDVIAVREWDAFGAGIEPAFTARKASNSRTAIA